MPGRNLGEVDSASNDGVWICIWMVGMWKYSMGMWILKNGYIKNGKKTCPLWLAPRGLKRGGKGHVKSVTYVLGHGIYNV